MPCSLGEKSRKKENKNPTPTRHSQGIIEGVGTKILSIFIN